MILHMLGTTVYHPNDRRETACYMLPEQGVILDAGSGMYRVRDLIETKQLDIFLTHAHLDHIMGLTFLFDVLWEKDVESVHVHGDAEKLRQIETHLFSEAIFPVLPPLEFHPLDGPFDLPDGGKLTYFPLKHPGGSLGFRLDWPDRSLAYVTDTTAAPHADYIENILDVDLLLHECYFPDGWEEKAELTGHSCLTPVAQVAAAADAGLLVLVHINPLNEEDDPLGIDAAKEIFPEIILAEDCSTIEF